MPLFQIERLNTAVVERLGTAGFTSSSGWRTAAATVERLDTAVSKFKAVGYRWFYFFERLEDRWIFQTK